MACWGARPSCRTRGGRAPRCGGPGWAGVLHSASERAGPSRAVVSTAGIDHPTSYIHRRGAGACSTSSHRSNVTPRTRPAPPRVEASPDIYFEIEKRYTKARTKPLPPTFFTFNFSHSSTLINHSTVGQSTQGPLSRPGDCEGSPRKTATKRKQKTDDGPPKEPLRKEPRRPSPAILATSNDIDGLQARAVYHRQLASPMGHCCCHAAKDLWCGC